MSAADRWALALVVAAALGCGNEGEPARPDSRVDEVISAFEQSFQEEPVESFLRSELDRLLGAVSTSAVTNDTMQQADAFGELGVFVHGLDRLDLAAIAYEEAHAATVLQGELSPRWPYLLAHTIHRRRDWTSAQEWFDVARASASDEGPIEGLVLLWLGEVALAQAQPERALELFEASYFAAPSCLRALLGAGRSLAALGRQQDAVLAFEMARLEQEDARDLLYSLGQSLASLGLTEEAAEVLERSQSAQQELRCDDPYMQAVEAGRRGTQVVAMRAERHAARRDWPRAEALWAEALKQSPERHDLRLNLALARLTTGQHRGLLELERLVEDAPSYGLARLQLASVHLDRGAYTTSRALVDEGLGLDPESPELLLAAGLVAVYQERFDDALAFLDHHLELDPASRRGRLTKATALLGAGRGADALTSLDRPEVVAPLTVRLMLKHGRIGDARRLLQSPPARGGKIRWLESRAMLAAASGNYSAAVELQTRAMGVASPLSDQWRAVQELRREAYDAQRMPDPVWHRAEWPAQGAGGLMAGQSENADDDRS